MQGGEELQVVTGNWIVFDLTVFIYATILFLLWDCSKMVVCLFCTSVMNRVCEIPAAVCQGLLSLQKRAR